MCIQHKDWILGDEQKLPVLEKKIKFNLTDDERLEFKNSPIKSHGP